ncbi:MAG: 3-deoxy-D-manno-octulosonic acid transferase [Alphaproteobacteria bacterium]
MLWTLYRLGTTLGGPLISLYLGRRERRGREEAARRGERRGRAGLPRPSGRLIWIHAASVGESLSVLPLIDRLLARDRGSHVLVTTGTVTSARLMGERLPPRALHQYVPVDRIGWVRRFLDHWRPDAAIWVESEFWPNLVIETHRRGVPMALVNARMSVASARSWRRVPRAIRRLLGCFSICLAQTERIAAVLTELGARSVIVAGNLKLAAPPLPADPDALTALRAAVGERPVWLAASTHPGEERMVAEADRIVRSHRPDLLTVIAPRHPGRGAEVAAVLRGMGLTLARRGAGEQISGETQVYLADTIGEMGVFYRVARLAFVGGSWVARGGQNPYEPAQLGCPVLFGQDMTNFPEISTLLVRAGAALTVAGPAECADVLGRLLGDPSACAQMAQAGRAVAADQRGVLDRLDQALSSILSPGQTGTTAAPGAAASPVGHARA